MSEEGKIALIKLAVFFGLLLLAIGILTGVKSVAILCMSVGALCGFAWLAEKTGEKFRKR